MFQAPLGQFIQTGESVTLPSACGESPGESDRSIISFACFLFDFPAHHSIPQEETGNFKPTVHRKGTLTAFRKSASYIVFLCFACIGACNLKSASAEPFGKGRNPFIKFTS